MYLTLPPPHLVISYLQSMVFPVNREREKVIMQTAVFQSPMMYGDHHVVEVRNLLTTLPGIDNIYASSAFRFIEIHYDETQLNEDRIKERLESAGYLGELRLPEETAVPANEQNGQQPFFRHTAVFAQAGKTVSFGQTMPAQPQRPLWPCPGINK